MPDSEQWRGAWQWASDGSTVNPQDLQIYPSAMNEPTSNVEQPHDFAAVYEEESESATSDQHTEGHQISRELSALVNENNTLDLNMTRIEGQEGAKFDFEDYVDHMVVQTRDLQSDEVCQNEDHAVNDPNKLNDEVAATESPLNPSRNGEAETDINDMKDATDCDDNKIPKPSNKQAAEAQAAIDIEDDKDSIEVATTTSNNKEAKAATGSDVFPKGQSSAGFVPIGSAGVANAEQGNAANFPMAEKVRIVAAERNFVPAMSYPQIAAKYPTWGVTQSRLRGMYYKAPGRSNPADTKRVKDPWTIEGVCF